MIKKSTQESQTTERKVVSNQLFSTDGLGVVSSEFILDELTTRVGYKIHTELCILLTRPPPLARA